MGKKIKGQIFLLSFISTIAFSQQTILIDFGDDYLTNAAANYNTVTNSADTIKITTLVNDEGASSGFTYRIIDAFHFLENSTGTDLPTGNSAIFDIGATKDSFFGNDILFQNVIEPTGAFVLTGLDDLKHYSFEVFASRMGVSDNRETLYTAVGTNTVSGLLDPANNETNTVLIDNVQPTGGVITFTVSKGPNNNNSSGYYYLGTLKMVETTAIDTQPPTQPTLSSTSQTDTSVALSWTAATDNIAVTGYKVYNGDVLVTTLGNVLSHEVIGLTASTAYTFTVTAFDVAGNESLSSNILSVTTNASSGGGAGYWTLNNQNVYYTNGNVGIGTTIPDSKLAVKGTIHSEEVRVDLSVPVPDYVFETDYNLTSLDKLQKYIKTHGHLPNMPSAKEMETHGIELGIMNMKLLEKIEEITLYILMQESRIKALEKNTNNNK